jgi:hypothetical protein
LHLFFGQTLRHTITTSFSSSSSSKNRKWGATKQLEKEPANWTTVGIGGWMIGPANDWMDGQRLRNILQCTIHVFFPLQLVAAEKVMKLPQNIGKMNNACNKKAAGLITGEGKVPWNAVKEYKEGSMRR